MEETYHRLGLKVRCKPMYGAELVPFNSDKSRLGCVTVIAGCGNGKPL